MSKKLYRQQAAFLRADNRNRSANLTPIDLEQLSRTPGMIAVWRSNRFLVQMFEPMNGGQRISINRTMVCEETGRWLDGITWDEIQKIKQQIGFGDRHAVEVYPPDSEIVNVANLRHIWLVDAPLFAWGSKC